MLRQKELGLWQLSGEERKDKIILVRRDEMMKKTISVTIVLIVLMMFSCVYADMAPPYFTLSDFSKLPEEPVLWSTLIYTLICYALYFFSLFILIRSIIKFCREKKSLDLKYPSLNDKKNIEYEKKKKEMIVVFVRGLLTAVIVFFLAYCFSLGQLPFTRYESLI